MKIPSDPNLSSKVENAWRLSPRGVVLSSTPGTTLLLLFHIISLLNEAVSVGKVKALNEKMAYNYEVESVWEKTR